MTSPSTSTPIDDIIDTLSSGSATDWHRCFRALVRWLRNGPQDESAAQRLQTLTEKLSEASEQTLRIEIAFREWIMTANLYPALVELGLFSRRGFLRELTERIYERLNPAPLNFTNLRHLLWFSFDEDGDADWLESMGPEPWLAFFETITRNVDRETWHAAHMHVREEALYALEMLSIWVAAEELEPELLRLEPALMNIDSAFVALQREVGTLVQAEKMRLRDPAAPPFDAAHLRVLLDQSVEQTARFRRRAISMGTSIALTHLLERLDQTLQRIENLLDILATTDTGHSRELAADLFVRMSSAASTQHQIKPLWRRNVRLLARSISENKSDHGEHYITRDRAGYMAMLRSAVGAGLVIAVLAGLKIQIESLALAPFASALLISLNYGLGFVLVHLFHFTIATKQPAMTAATLASGIEKGERGRANQRKLADILINVIRSQFAAVTGNVIAALALALVISMIVPKFLGGPLLDEQGVQYQYDAVNPLTSPALFYAGIAGVWLFLSGLIAGYFDNRADYLELRERLQIHPLFLRFIPSKAGRERIADYLHENYGAIAGNFLFGCLLGMTGYVGYLTGLPLDIRHVAFSSANVGYATAAGHPSVFEFATLLLFTLMIGVVNLIVSFWLALWIALRARETGIGDLLGLARTFVDRVREAPRVLVLPAAEVEDRSDQR
jgi:site-specific recombinase